MASSSDDAHGKITGSITNSDGEKASLVWWHDSTSPFVVEFIFSENCNKFKVRFYKSAAIMDTYTNALGGTDTIPGSAIDTNYKTVTAHSETRYKDGVQYRFGGTYGMCYYIVIGNGADKTFSDLIEELNEKPLSEMQKILLNSGGINSYTDEYNYPFAYSSVYEKYYVCHLPNQTIVDGNTHTQFDFMFPSCYNDNNLKKYFGTLIDREQTLVNSDGISKITSDGEWYNSAYFGLKENRDNNGDMIMQVYGSCEAAIRNEDTSYNCWSFSTPDRKSKIAMGNIIDVNFDMLIKPESRSGTYKSSGTTIASQINWLPSSKPLSDKLFYRLMRNKDSKYINDNGTVTTSDSYRLASSHTYKVDYRRYSELLFTGLDNGETYKLEYYILAGSDSQKYLNASINITTFKVDGDISEALFRRATFKGITSGGSGVNTSAKVLMYQILKKNTTSILKSNTMGKNVNTTVTGLDVDTTYTLRLYMPNVKPYTLKSEDFYDNTIQDTGAGTGKGPDGSDAYVELEFKTKKPFDWSGPPKTTTTGETFTATQVVTLNDSRNCTLTFKIYTGVGIVGTPKATATVKATSATQSSFTYKFTGLDRGTQYYVAITAEDDASPETNNTLSTIGMVDTTYKLLLTPLNANVYTAKPDSFESDSTNALRFRIEITHGDSRKDTMATTFNIDGDATAIADATWSMLTNSSSKTVTYKKLVDNETYEITSQVVGMDDTKETVYIKTKLFVFIMSVTDIGLDRCTINIGTYAQSYNNVRANLFVDPITEYKTSIIVDSGSTHNSHIQYKPGTDMGFATKTADADKQHITIDNFYKESATSKVFTGLDYFTTYEAMVTMTDGYNIKVLTMLFVTLFPYVRIYDGTSWKLAMPLIYDSSKSKYIPAAAMVYNGSTFKIANPQ